MALAMVLSGCQNRVDAENTTQVKEKAAATAAEVETLHLKQCQQTLSALHNVEQKQFDNYKQNFDLLMKGAAQYSDVRAKIKTETRDTVDALYRYKVNKLCSQVDQAVMVALAAQGESVK
ncbi:hypothetical protein [Erwinia persicina]|uniref:hypothetical protein n=1 Tax=Erwinia persicina TaxID=55211 RepID=UPI00178272C6|nr:hypothetical protein [Erwinia persicina]MBD8162659.1 hypothetical protein [Erwinia persicina]MBD8214697.1 hypothetical protein [Erwinia persicina]